MTNQHGHTITSRREKRYEVESDPSGKGHWIAVGNPHTDELTAMLDAEKRAAFQLEIGVPVWGWRVVRVLNVRTVVQRLAL